MTLMKKLAGALALSVLAVAPAMAQYPDHAINLIVPWAAGGGTDATGRIVATLLEKELGQPVNVINRTGGGGIVGHTEISYSPPDGYTLGVITTELSMYHWIGTSPLNYSNYDALALFNADPEAVYVRTDGPDIDALLEEIRANPGSVKASGANLGGMAHLGWAGVLTTNGIDPSAAPWVPSEGASASLQLLASGAISVVTTTMPDAQPMVDAGEVKPLLVAAEARVASAPDVPTAEEALGNKWAAYAWRGIGAPKGLPDDVKARLVEALDNVINSDEFKEFMAQRKFGIDYRDAAGFEAFMKDADESIGQALQAVGLAQ
ncbi:Bug family tripartite tricarboxylate transporter substrate binding protein [Devosia ginsengisoli]|uniref:Tripartite tricarboxylate transporter substrate binding protein n=1 Tax=Devosia ginsengisoli TaxID=400770 RepID=A0A5B8LN72_9HYPH|nr:tripartite tricarboxylate transporter substrate binding protein [Devosia ginsengisoli]QDZ09516.1 tripartite tricarboxylate transporter substrate binding protein [Devosia ginsengisoli]